jgi:mRNA interferase RelE/StbE
VSSGWTLKFGPRARKSLRKIDRKAAQRIVVWLEALVVARGEPRALGKALTGELARFWRYRVGDYRILASIEDEIVTVLVVEVGHRSSVYRR